MVSGVLLLEHSTKARQFIINLGEAERVLDTMDQRCIGGNEMSANYLVRITVVTLPHRPIAIVIRK